MYSKKLKVYSIVALFVFLTSFFSPFPALADDPPPPPTETPTEEVVPDEPPPLEEVQIGDLDDGETPPELDVVEVEELEDGETPPELDEIEVEEEEPPAELNEVDVEALGDEAPNELQEVDVEALVTEVPPTEESAEAAPEPEAQLEGEVGEEPAAEEESEEDIAEIVQDAAENDITIADENGEPLEFVSQEAADLLSSGDPFFYDGTQWVGFDPGGDDCPSFVAVCNDSTTPFQDAIDAVTIPGTIIYVAGSGDSDAPTLYEDIVVGSEDQANLSFVAFDSAFAPTLNTSGDAVETYTAGYAQPNSITLNNIFGMTSGVYSPDVTVNSGGTIQDGVDLVTPGGTVQVNPGTYNEEVTIPVEKANITLTGDPGDETAAGAAWDAPVLDGSGVSGDTGITVNAEGLTLSGFIIQNYDTAILQDVVSGSNAINILNNTIQNNVDGLNIVKHQGSPGTEVHYNIFQNNSGYAIINNDGDNNQQFVQAQDNYWGCTSGPVVAYKYNYNKQTGSFDGWGYIDWATRYDYGLNGDNDDPDPNCALLYGFDEKYDFQINSPHYSPYKIKIDSIATTVEPYCGDGIVTDPEVCDDGVNNGQEGYCNATCTGDTMYCGDGIVTDPEVCDDGVNNGQEGYCNATCTGDTLYCGDGVVNQTSEECDGNAGVGANQSCNNDCTLIDLPYCGDGIVNQPSEKCDDGNNVNTDGCTNACMPYTPPPPDPVVTFTALIPVTGGETHAIAAGIAHTCALTPEGGVECWGNNDYGQLGDGSFTGSNVRVDVVGLEGGTTIVAGANQTCVLAGDEVWCWGQNNKGQVGDGTTTNRNTPVKVLGGAVDVTAGYDYTCAVMTYGQVMCWGNNDNGQLADGSNGTHTTPTLSSLITGLSNVDAGRSQNCGLTATGLIRCVSSGASTSLGEAAETNLDVAVNRFGSTIMALNNQRVPVQFLAGTPTLVSQLSDVKDVDSGQGHRCALLNTGEVQCWGINYFGQLGNDSKRSSTDPVPVKDMFAAYELAVGMNHTCVMVPSTGLGDPGIKCWGLNTDGQLGDGTYETSNVPVNVK